MPDMSLWSFIAHADIVVKTVMLILLCASIASWTIIFQRSRLLKNSLKEARTFEQRFWSGIDLAQMFQQLGKQRQTLSGMAAIFYAGFDEFLKAKQKHEHIIQHTERAMRIAESNEMSTLEQHLSFLATVGSNSVYIGLLGTVWGIMSAFRGLGAVQHATIAMVAPGISEALIATAMGLVAAIPAVIAYNFFTAKIDRIQQSYQTFQEEFSGVLHHQMPTAPGAIDD